MRPLVREGAQAVCLVKPQFEAGREKVGKKGVVRDPAVHLEVLEHFLDHAREAGFSVKDITFSPINGPEGNIEYLGWLGTEGEGPVWSGDLRELVERVPPVPPGEGGTAVKSAAQFQPLSGPGACGRRWRPSRILNNAGAETALCLPFAPRKGDRLDLPRQVKLAQHGGGAASGRMCCSASAETGPSSTRPGTPPSTTCPSWG